MQNSIQTLCGISHSAIIQYVSTFVVNEYENQAVLINEPSSALEKNRLIVPLLQYVLFVMILIYCFYRYRYLPIWSAKLAALILVLSDEFVEPM